MSRGVQVRERVMGEATVSRSHAPLEALAGKDRFPGASRPARTRLAMAEDQFS